jgi:hypothetical protein
LVLSRSYTRTGVYRIRQESELQMHVAEQAWIDFVRGLLPTDEAEALRAHLTDGCSQCQDAQRLWSSLWIAARREQSYQGPDAVVRAAKAAFVLRQKIPLLSRVGQVAQKVFDSFLEPLPAGIRGSSSGPRYLLHQTGNFMIDFRLEYEGANQCSLTGQVLDCEGEATTAHTGIVLLSDTDEFIAQTAANSFGEFQLEFESETKVKLFLAVPEGTVLAVYLPDSTLPKA